MRPMPCGGQPSLWSEQLKDKAAMSGARSECRILTPDGFGSDTRVKLVGGRSLMANVATLSVVLPRGSCKANAVRGCDTRESSVTSARPYWSFLVDPSQWRPARPSQWA